MKDIPILFSPEMVRQLPPKGPKRQTRRTRGLDVINESPDDWTLDHISPKYGDPEFAVMLNRVTGEIRALKCPYGPAGTRLRVKEGWRPEPVNIDGDGFMRVRYLADKSELLFPYWMIPNGWTMPKAATRGGVTALFMPYWASRFTFVNTGWRLERAQDITEEDAKAEGAVFHDGHGIGHSGWRHDDGDVFETARDSFLHLIDKINNKTLPAANNHWLWVINFKEAK